MSPTPALFASTFPYALIKHARVLGELQGGAEEEFALIRKHEKLRKESPWPAYQTMGELDSVEPFYLASDAGGSVAQARSRMAGRFWRQFPSCDVWLSVDDDVYAERDVLERLIATCRESGGAVTVPYLLRDGRTVSLGNVVGQKGGPYFAVTSGMGLVALHRHVVESLIEHAPKAVDDKGMRYPALFLEFIDEWLGWLSEDIALSHRLQTATGLSHPWRVLDESPITHAGRRFMMRSDGMLAVDDKTSEGL